MDADQVLVRCRLQLNGEFLNGYMSFALEETSRPQRPHLAVMYRAVHNGHKETPRVCSIAAKGRFDFRHRSFGGTQEFRWMPNGSLICFISRWPTVLHLGPRIGLRQPKGQWCDANFFSEELDEIGGFIKAQFIGHELHLHVGMGQQSLSL